MTTIDSIDALGVARVTLDGLLGVPGERFEIPHYQRKYAWEKVNHEEFFQDVREAARTNRTHFFSNVTLSSLDGKGRYYVVDGQQRVTTLGLFLEALRQATGDERLNRYLRDGELLKLSFEDRMDQRTYRHLLLRHFCDPESLSENMAGGFRYFEGQFGGEKEKWREYLNGGLLDKLLFVRVLLPAAMPPQRVFERMNATKVPVSEFDMIKNFLLMESGGDERKVYDFLEGKLSDYSWRSRMQVLVSMHTRGQVSQESIYVSFRIFYHAGPSPVENAMRFLERVESWTREFNKVCSVFRKLGLYLGDDDWRVYGAGGYAALLMKLAIVFPAPEDEARRNKLVARMIAHLRNWIAIERLNEKQKIHLQKWDAEWTYRCLKQAGDGYEQNALESAIRSVFFEYRREPVDAAITRWVEGKLSEKGYTRNAALIGLKETPALPAVEVVEAFHRDFEERKRSLGIVSE